MSEVPLTFDAAEIILQAIREFARVKAGHRQISDDRFEAFAEAKSGRRWTAEGDNPVAAALALMPVIAQAMADKRDRDQARSAAV